MSFGTVVRSCLIRVGTNNPPGSELEVCSGCDSHEARRTGTEPNRGWKPSRFGVAFLRFQLRVSTAVRSQ